MQTLEPNLIFMNVSTGQIIHKIFTSPRSHVFVGCFLDLIGYFAFGFEI